MGTMVVISLAFLAGFMTVFSVSLVITDLHQKDMKQIRKKMERELYEREREKAIKAAKSGTLAAPGLGELAAAAALENADHKSITEKLEELLIQAGMRITPMRLIVTAAIATVGVGLVGWLASGLNPLGAVLGLLGGIVPFLYVQWKRNKRLDALRAQLPDALELMVRMLRAGQTITHALQAVAQEFRPPISHEFGYCYEQQNLGLSPEMALKDLTRRTGLLELKILVLGLTVHRQTGGNLTLLLESLSTMIRERFKLRGKISALTAEGRVQGIILMLVPPVMFGVLLLVNYTYIAKHFEFPAILGGAVVLMAMGGFWIHKIINFDF